MYGLVNRAIRGLVEERFGEEAWEKISARAGVSSERFVAMDAYDDAITYGLVGAASEELGLDPGAILEAFGEYWTLFTLEEGYGDMLSMMGTTLDEFLDNLDSMHQRIQETMPALIPPSFDREDQGDGTYVIPNESSSVIKKRRKEWLYDLDHYLERQDLDPDEVLDELSSRVKKG
ncbi:MAG: heme NO-binding domain-containing protein, partial [Planctomycetota bacterium]